MPETVAKSYKVFMTATMKQAAVVGLAMAGSLFMLL